MFLPWNEVEIYLSIKNYYFLKIMTGIDIFNNPLFLMNCSPKEAMTLRYNFLCASMTVSFLHTSPPPFVLFQSTASQLSLSIFSGVWSLGRALMIYLWKRYLSIGLIFFVFGSEVIAIFGRFFGVSDGSFVVIFWAVFLIYRLICSFWV